MSVGIDMYCKRTTRGALDLRAKETSEIGRPKIIWLMDFGEKSMMSGLNESDANKRSKLRFRVNIISNNVRRIWPPPFRSILLR